MNLKVARAAIPITIAILILGGWLHLRFTRIGWSPYTTDAIDEIWIFNESYERYVTHEAERRLDGYPPFILWVQAVAWRIVNMNWEGGSAAIPALTLTRLFTLLPAVSTLLLLYLIGKALHSDLVGWVIALGWAVQPTILEVTTNGLTEAWQVPFIALAIWLAIIGLRRSSATALIGATVAGLLAVTAKYSAFPALGFGVGAALWLSLKDWRRGFAIVAVQGLTIVTGAVLLLYGYGAIVLLSRGEAATFISGGLQQYRNFTSFVSLLGVAQSQLSIGIVAVIIAAIGIAHYIRYAERWQQVTLSMIIIVAFSLLVSALFYVNRWDIIERYSAPATVTTVVMVGIGFAEFAHFISAAVKDTVKRRHTFYIIFGIISLLWLLPPAITSLQDALRPNYPRVEGQMIEWSRLALHEGTILLPQESGWLWVYFDGEFGGYPPPLRTWMQDAITKHSLGEWRDMYIYYALLRDHEIEQLQATATGRKLLDEMLLLRTFPTYPAAPWSGDTTHIYSTRGINHSTDVTFAEQIDLHGLYLDVPEDIEGGTVITFTPFWQALTSIDTNYQLFVHVIPQDDTEIIAQVDTPVATEQYPVTQWQVEDNAIVGRSVSVTLPTDIQPGNYRVIIGLYDLATFQRLMTSEQLDYYTVYEFTIVRE